MLNHALNCLWLLFGREQVVYSGFLELVSSQLLLVEMWLVRAGPWAGKTKTMEGQKSSVCDFTTSDQYIIKHSCVILSYYLKITSAALKGHYREEIQSQTLICTILMR